MYRGKRRGKKGLKTAVRKLQRSVAKLKVNREIKELYTNVSTLTNTGAGAGFGVQAPLCDVVQGTAYNQRVGNKIVPQALKMKIVMQGTVNAFSATTVPQMCRIILFQDLGYNGTIITGSQLLQTYSAAAGNLSTAMSPINTDYVKSKNVPDGRIHILYDKALPVHPVLSAYSDRCYREVKINISAKKLKEIYFNGVGSNTFVGGSIFAFMALGNAAVASDNPTVAFNTKLTYYDD